MSKTKPDYDAFAFFTETNQNPEESSTDKAVTSEPSQKKKVGRPISKDVKKNYKLVSAKLPIELIEQWNIYKPACGGNLTEYITRLIEADFAANGAQYQDIVDRLPNK